MRWNSLIRYAKEWHSIDGHGRSLKRYLFNSELIMEDDNDSRLLSKLSFSNEVISNLKFLQNVE